MLTHAPRFPAISNLGNQHGMLLPPSSHVVAYVHASPAPGEYPQDIAEKIVPTLASAISKCRSGYGDVIVVLRGHAENVTDDTMFANLKAGTTIIGENEPTAGASATSATFTWTNTAGQWTIDQADVTISRLNLDLTGVDAVAEAIAVSGGSSIIEGCILQIAGASTQVSVALTYNTGSDASVFRGNVMTGINATATSDVPIQVANGIASLYVYDNLFMGPCPVAGGFIQIGAAAKLLYIADNDMYNTTAASTACISVGDFAADGIICRNTMGTLNNGVAASQGIVFGGTTPTIKCFENYSADEPRASGVIAPAVVAT